MLNVVYHKDTAKKSVSNCRNRRCLEINKIIAMGMMRATIITINTMNTKKMMEELLASSS